MILSPVVFLVESNCSLKISLLLVSQIVDIANKQPSLLRKKAGSSSQLLDATALLASIRLVLKGLPGRNTLTQLTGASVTNKKRVYDIDTWSSAVDLTHQIEEDLEESKHFIQIDDRLIDRWMVRWIDRYIDRWIVGQMDQGILKGEVSLYH